MKRSAIVFFILIFCALYGIQAAMAAPPWQEATPESNAGKSCGDCHLDYHAAWESGVHASAYDDPIFQEAWARDDKNPDCLQCHTTEYQPATGTYMAENIECEACHGPNPANHPPEPITVRTDAGVCSDCHSPTFDQWEHSLHAFAENMGAIGCATCHNPHGQTLRFDTVSGLCLNCHRDNPENPDPYAETYVHLTHNEIQTEGVDVTCASCHMLTESQDQLHSLPDHTMKVSTVPCTNCHEQVAQSGVETVLTGVNSSLAVERDELIQKVSLLESDLQAANEREVEASTPNYIQLTQGLIGGLGIGITLVLVLFRRSNGHGKSQEAEVDERE